MKSAQRDPRAEVGVGRQPPTSVFVYCAVGGHGGPVQSVVALQHALTRHRMDWFAGAWSALMRRKIDQLDDGRNPEVIDITRPKGLHTLRAIAELALVLRRLPKGNVVMHANGLTELSLMLPLLAIKHLPAVVWVHNFEIPRKARVLRHASFLMPRRLQVAAVSAAAARVARVALGEGREVSIVPNPLRSPGLAQRKRRASNRLCVGFLGTDRPYKGFDLLVRTIERTSGHEFEWIVASNPHATDHRNWDRLLASDGHGVRVVGRMPEASDVYALCDAVFVPSRAESFCRVAAEALANGLFVVASDLEPLREFAMLGDTISFFPVGDVDTAIERLREIAAMSVDERLERGADVARRAAAAFSAERVAALLESLYDAALEGESLSHLDADDPTKRRPASRRP